MQYNSDKHHRRSIRLRNYDYSTPASYFVTICVQNRACLFGDIVDGTLRLNDAGTMTLHTWTAMPRRFSAVELDQFIVMPNHFHAILHVLKPPCASALTHLSAIVGAFKSITTNAYIQGVHSHGWPLFAGRLWQRTYWDRVIRDEGELARLREYVETNVARWHEDQLYHSMPGPASMQESLTS